MKRCVVIGASGLIGSHLLPGLAREWDVHAVSRQRPRLPGSAAISWHGIDVSLELPSNALPDRSDAVVYLAQSEHFREFPERAMDVFQVNTMGLLRFLDYARRSGARSFVYASSGGVYGSRDSSLNEDAPVHAEGNLGFYLGSKLCSEILALNYAKILNIVVLRFFFVYGPGQRRTMLIPRLIDSVREGRAVTLQGEDGIRFNPTFVSDAVAALLRALVLRGTHVINVAGPEVLSLRRAVDVIGARVGREPRFEVRSGEPPVHLVANTEKMSRLLHAPRVSFERGVQMTLDAEHG